MSCQCDLVLTYNVVSEKPYATTENRGGIVYCVPVMRHTIACLTANIYSEGKRLILAFLLTLA